MDIYKIRYVIMNNIKLTYITNMYINMYKFRYVIIHTHNPFSEMQQKQGSNYSSAIFLL